MTKVALREAVPGPWRLQSCLRVGSRWEQRGRYLGRESAALGRGVGESGRRATWTGDDGVAAEAGRFLEKRL